MEISVDIGFRRKLYLGIFILAMLNFLAYWLIAVQLGGDAVNGKAEGGRYYLMSHGVYTEVSAAVFDYSRWHTYSVWLTHPLGVMAAIFYYKLGKPGK